MKQNSLETAAKYALQRMEEHATNNVVSLGFDCGVSTLRDVLGVPLDDKDRLNLATIGYSPACTEHYATEAPQPCCVEEEVKSLRMTVEQTAIYNWDECDKVWKLASHTAPCAPDFPSEISINY